jgi:hypothetical protein
MTESLSNANFASNILPCTGKSFPLSDLVSILMVNSHDKFNVIYNKFFYGFEKENKSAYYFDKAVTGLFIPFKYPIREDYIPLTLMKELNIPIIDASVYKVKPV